MMRAMTRVAVVGTAALAAMAAIAVGPELSAKPTRSPFAGKFAGPVPGALDPWTISISGSGRIKGTLNLQSGFISATGSLSGTVSDAGIMQCDGAYTWSSPLALGGGGGGPFTLSATAIVNAAGDIEGTTASGATFVWERQ